MITILSHVEAHPGHGRQLVEAFEAYAQLVRECEDGILFFDICQKFGAPEDHFIYLEGFESDEARKKHNEAPYKADHVAKMRVHIKHASARQLIERSWQ